MKNIKNAAVSVGSAVAISILALAPTLASAVTINSNLSFGTRSTDVSTLQRFLADDPSLYPEGLVTGYFGPATQRAVVRFQSRYGITPAVGFVGPITIAKLAGLSSSLGDVNAPLMSNATVATTTTSGAISWTTSEPARHRVMYGLSYPFLYATAPAIISEGVGTATTLTISGLSPNTNYYFVRESTDLTGNVMLTTVESFRTKQ